MNNQNNSHNPFEVKAEVHEQFGDSFNFESKSNGNLNPFESILDPEDEKSLFEKSIDLSKRDTNFIFLFGRPGSGKSYITASLIYYMQTSELGKLIVSPHNDKDSNLLIQDMYKTFQTRRVFDRTFAGAPPYEIDLIFKPHDRRLPAMKITFLEISGENLEKVHITKNRADSGKLPDNIDVYLMNKDVKLTFFLVSDHVNASRDALTISDFLNYVYNKDPKFEHSKYLLAITKWDTYRGRHRHVENFTEEAMPNIYARLRNEQIGNAITHYTIGEVMKMDYKGQQVDQIKSIDMSRAEAVTNWLYKTITGKSLIPEPTLWEKIRAFFGI